MGSMYSIYSLEAEDTDDGLSEQKDVGHFELREDELLEVEGLRGIAL